jgi:NitT/TauT family transport system substrate-binding protein
MFTRLAAITACLGLTALASAATASTDLGTVNLSWSPGPDTPQVAQAMDKGLWTQRGVTVHTSSTPTGREALEALIGGQVDYALMAELPPVIGAMQHKNFRIIALLSRYSGERIISTPAVDLSSPKNLAGKRIGTILGTSNDYQTFAVLRSAGVSATVVNAGPSDLVPALARGDIDAACMFPQFYPQAKKVLGDRYRERRTPEYVGTFVLVATVDEIAKHPDRVRAMLSGLLAANELVTKNPAESAAVVSKAMGGLSPAADIQTLWADYHFGILLDRPLIQLLDEEGHWVHNSGYVKGPEPDASLFSSYVDASLLKAVAPRNVQL